MVAYLYQTMAKSANNPINVEDLQGFKMIEKFKKILERTNSDALPAPTELDPRRKLSQNDYFSLFLFTYLNPVLKSMRGLCSATYLEKIQQTVCSNPVSLGSFSEAQSIFDPQLLLGIIQSLAAEFQPEFGDKRIRELCKELVAVDGTLIRALPRMAWALWQNDDNRSAKLHLHYSVLRQTVINASVTDANSCERAELDKLIKKDFVYVADRYYGGDYRFFEKFGKKDAYFVIRIRNNAVIHELESFPITEDDCKVGVVWDKKIQLGDEKNPKGPYRAILIKAWGKELLILTNRWDIPAELISLIYWYRWKIEDLFKWIKCNLQCRHLLAESKRGVTIQVYIAIIASLLLFLALGHRPKKRELELIHMYSSGWASVEELYRGLGLKKRD
jgi:hypothetical protein